MGKTRLDFAGQSGRIVNVGSMAAISTLQQSSPPYAAARRSPSTAAG